MLVFASARAVINNEIIMSRCFNIYNLSSPIEGFNRLDLFIQPSKLFSYDSKDFDIKYYNFIMNVKFMELMKVMMDLYYGKDVIILISDNIDNNIVSESLQKVIQQRYGLLSYVLYEPDDFASISIDKSEFSIQGLYNLDQDKERYTQILNSMYSEADLERMQHKLEIDNPEI